MVQITNTHWAVEVPEGAKELHIEVSLKGSPYIGYKFKDDELLNEYQNIYLPPGAWEIVCTSKDKKIPNGIVECKTVEYDGSVQGTRFVNYMNPNQRRWFINKTDSLRSLLTSKGCDLNRDWLILKRQ
jgi:hypothetical protein